MINRTRLYLKAAGLLLCIFTTQIYTQTGDHPVEVGAFLTIADFKASVGEKPLGIGGRFTYNFNDNIALDSELAYFPQNPSGNFGQTVALVGIKAGVRAEKLGVFAKIRPGIANFGGRDFRATGNNQTKFALDIGGVIEYYPTSRLIIRADLGDTIIPFGNDVVNNPTAIRPGTTNNFQSSIGVGFRF
ncbi:MAG: outer membrane beta-barrel protein [Acidobacteria bacterium]|nr:outer membrane beta-barrel protein [Acidobacteriota bacterium]